jgi:hypothetical protein
MSEVAVTAFLFVTDLDHTLVGDDNALKELNQNSVSIVRSMGQRLFMLQGDREVSTMN